MIGYDYGNLWEWEKFNPSRLLEVMRSFEAPWWIAGGWALDLWLGHETRTHRDVDVAILRSEQKKLHEALRGWELYYATADHRLVPYLPDLWLGPPLHGVWARAAPDVAWLGEFLLNEHEGSDWVYRRNPAVRKPLADIGTVVRGGLPVLVPEIVLLYKAHDLAAGAGVEKAESDFHAALPRLRPSAKVWLLHALNESTPNHPWATQLRAEGSSDREA